MKAESSRKSVEAYIIVSFMKGFNKLVVKNP